MIYQFEHKEIKHCYECPLVDGEYGDCNITGTEGVDGAIPDDCPLVAISKTETTSCEWCEKIGKYAGFDYATFFEQTSPDEQYEIPVECNYCPNCGRRLEETE